MNPVNRNINSYINNHDLEGLRKISNIKENQVIDVNENGTISEPYDVGSWDKQGIITSSWRTLLWMSGTGSNRDDIPKIKSLMQRALLAYKTSGSGSIKNYINNALPGLENLKKYYLNKQKEGTCKDIDNIVNFVSSSIMEIEKTGFKIESFTEKEIKRHRELNILEESCIGSAITNEGTYGPLEGLNYYKERIKDFLFLEKNNLETQDFAFLTELDKALDFAKNHYNHSYMRGWVERALSICGEENRSNEDLWDKAISQASRELKTEMATKFIDSLEAMTPDYREQIGIQFPMRWGWTHERQYEGHIFFINVCKDPDGTYTFAQANAGGLALGDIASLSLNMNFNVPISFKLSTIVEFRGLSKEETVNFLIKVKEKQEIYPEDRLEAKKKYDELFDLIIDKKNIDRIPPRRQQIVNNCGVRSVKELLIYAFQKSNRIALANKFLTYTDGRGSNTLPFEEVKPLIE